MKCIFTVEKFDQIKKKVNELPPFAKVSREKKVFRKITTLYYIAFYSKIGILFAGFVTCRYSRRKNRKKKKTFLELRHVGILEYLQ